MEIGVSDKKNHFTSAMLDEDTPIFKEEGPLKYFFLFLFLFVLWGCSQEDSDRHVASNELTIVREENPPHRKFLLNERADSDRKLVLLDTKPISLEGTKLDWFEDGSKKQELNYSDGKKNGSFTKWYPNGQLQKKGGYKDDRFDGFFEAWNDEGVRRWTGSYRVGKQHGEWIFFDKNGAALPAIYFKDGIETTRELPIFRE